MRATGLMRAGAPASLGALEAPPAVDAGGRRDGSRAETPQPAGACRSPPPAACSSAYLPEEGAAEIFGDPRMVAAGVWAPRGRARRVDGGLRVSGRWSFCSGISHSEWLFAGCVLEDRAGRRRGRTDAARGGAARRPSSRSSTPGTRAACAAPAATTRSPTSCSSPITTCCRCSTRRRGSTRRCTASRSSASSRCRSRPRRWATRAGRSTSSTELAAGKDGTGLEPRARRSVPPRRRRSARRRRRCGPREPSTTRRSTEAWEAAQQTRTGRRVAAPRACDSRRPTPSGPRPRSPARCTTSAAAPRSTRTRRCSGASATPTPRPRTSRSTPRPGS